MPRRFAIAAGPSSALSCLICVSVDADRAALVLAGGLRLGDALALSLQHDFPLPCRHGQDGQHELAGRVAGVQPLAAHGQDYQADAPLRQIGLWHSSSAVLRASLVRLG